MIVVDFEVSPADRADILQALRPLLAEARAVDGNLGYRAVTDSESAAHIGLTHAWETLEHFRAYAASDLFHGIGGLLRPAMTTPPVSRRLRADSLEEIRG